MESRLPSVADHRVWEASELAKLAGVEAAESVDAREAGRVEGTHRVEAEEVEADRAEVDAGHREVPQARRAERAPVAHTVREDAPGEAGLVLVRPRGLDEFEVVVRLDLAEPVRHPANPEGTIEALPSAGSSTLRTCLNWCVPRFEGR